MKRLLVLLAAACGQGLFAQGLLLGPDPTTVRPPGTGPALAPTTSGPLVHIVRSSVQADIVDGIATTTIDQLFRNDGGTEAEGTWFLPLPEGAVADGFTMTVNGKEMKGEVLDAATARDVYESIVRRKRDPGLLEYAGNGLLRARIYPIPARSEVGVTVRLRQVLQPRGGLYEWSWPNVARRGDAATGVMGVSVRIRSQTPLRTIVTPHPTAEIRRPNDNEATVSLEGDASKLADLKVLYGLGEQEFGLHLLNYRANGEDGYFTMLLSPPRTLAGQRPTPRCVQLVIDASGSMAGIKMTQAKAALATFVKRLAPTDQFQIVAFASTANTFFAAPVPADDANKQTALQRIEGLQAMGGTNIGDALERAFASATTSTSETQLLQQIVFITDGQPSVGITAPQRIVELTKQADKAGVRLFALGVGTEIDVPLLDDLVEQHRGTREFMLGAENMEVKVDGLCQKLAQPALTDVVLRCDGLDSFDVHPGKLRDLFCGEVMQIVGRYRGDGKRTVVVTGKHGGVSREYRFDVEFPAASLTHGFVPTVWARQHVAALIDAIRRNGASTELMTEVRRLATQFGIVTPFTSNLILEESDRLRLGSSALAARRRLHDIPDGGRLGGPSGPATGGPGGPSVPGAGPGVGAPRSGAEAVRKSLEARGDGSDRPLQTGSADGGDAQREAGGALVQRAGGRGFVRVGDELVEQGLPDDWQQKVEVVVAFSDAYFELLKANPELAQVFALGPQLVLRVGTKLIRVRPEVPTKS